MEQRSFFAVSERLGRLSQIGDPLEVLEQTVDFEYFRGWLVEGSALATEPGAGRPADCAHPFPPHPGRNRVRSAARLAASGARAEDGDDKRSASRPAASPSCIGDGPPADAGARRRLDVASPYILCLSI